MNQTLSRRRFTLLSAAAAAGATLFDAPMILQAAGLADMKEPYGGFPMGAQSYSLRNFSVIEAIRHLEGMGLHYVEMYRKHLALDADEQQIADLQRVLDKAGIQLVAHGVNNFTKDHAANRAVFEFAKRAGIRSITANPEYDAFDSLDKLVAEFKIRVAIHNHGPGALYDKIDDLKKVVDGRHPLIGACVDTGHFLRSREDPLKAVRELNRRVYGVHVKDVAQLQDRTHNVVIGTGHLDVVGLFRSLRQINFPADGALSLEYEANPENPIDDMKQCLEVARDAIQQAV